MRRIVSGILEGLVYEVQQAGHGREGLDVLDGGWLPDLVCVDWNMPVMDGLQFVSAVRSNPAWRQVTIMMVTSESEHGQIVRALEQRDAERAEILMREHVYEGRDFVIRALEEDMG